MSAQTFSRSIRINRPAHEVFAWHERPGTLERLSPPWEAVALLSHEGIRDGARAEIRTRTGMFSQTWVVEHRDFVEGKQFRDVQMRGPFRSWEHLHEVTPEGSAACTLTDTIRYELPGGSLGRAIAGGRVRERLERLFRYRHEVTRTDVELTSRHGSVRGMRFLMAGASGLIGQALIPFLRSQGHDVVRLVRRGPVDTGEIFWDPEKGELDAGQLRGVDVVVNLAGANVAAGRWTAGRREAIRASRVNSTRTLVTTIEKMRHRPFTFVNASAVGIYGARGAERVTEESGPGTGFLAEVCEAWERETAAAEALGLRAIALRTGVVLTPAGGALAKLLPVFRAGLGGRSGAGKQAMSWIAMDDWLGAFYHAVLDQRCGGPVNTVAPEVVTNAEFAACLGRVLRRPSAMAVPGWALRLALGRMADETLLSGARVEPGRLDEARYEFRFPKLEEALRHLLGR